MTGSGAKLAVNLESGQANDSKVQLLKVDRGKAEEVLRLSFV